MKLGMGGLQAAFAKHRTPILVGGAGVVSAAGLYVHHKNATDPTAGADTSTTAAPAAAPIAGGATIAGTDPGSVDTSATDVYDALQPQMAQEQSLLAQLLDAMKNQLPVVKTPPLSGPPTTKPKPKPTPKPKPKPKPPVHTKPPKGPTHKTPAKHYYTVVKGDSLWKIAIKYHTTWPKIYAANRAVIGKNPNLIKPGQRLVIP